VKTSTTLVAILTATLIGSVAHKLHWERTHPTETLENVRPKVASFYRPGGFGAGSKVYNLTALGHKITCYGSSIDKSCPDREIIEGQNYQIVIRKKWPGIGDSYDAVSVEKLPSSAK